MLFRKGVVELWSHFLVDGASTGTRRRRRDGTDKVQCVQRHMYGRLHSINYVPLRTTKLHVEKTVWLQKRRTTYRTYKCRDSSDKMNK